MVPIHVALFCLTDDPFEPPGHGPRGGSHKVMFDLGRHLVRRGARVTFVTRLDSLEKPATQEFGELCRIIRVAAGPPQPIPYYRYEEYVDQAALAVEAIPELQAHRVTTVVSYNWNSGLVVARVYPRGAVDHVHYVLALGRARLAAGESREKISDAWLQAEDTVFSHASRIVTCSTSERAELAAFYPSIDTSSIHYVPLGVDTEVFDRRPRDPGHLVRRSATRFQEGIEHASRRAADT